MNPPDENSRLPRGTKTHSSPTWARHLAADVAALDRAVYDAVANTPTPALDEPISRISNAANSAQLWIVAAALLAVIGGPRGRHAAIRGVTSIGVTSVVTNGAAKQAFRRRRPRRSAESVRSSVRMPMSSSFPSGHTASAFAFATAVSADVPELCLVMYGLAGVIGFSRVSTGVHYPSDVIGGCLLGLVIGTAAREVRISGARLQAWHVA